MQRIHPVAHDNNSADGLSLAVPLHNALANVRTKRHRSKVAHQDGRAVLRCYRHDFQIVRRMQVTEPANHVLRAAHLQHAAANFVGAVTDTVDHHRKWNVVGAEFVGIQIHLVLANESSNGSNFRYARDCFQLIPEIPILKGAQVRKAVLVGAVNHRVFVHPSRTGGVGPNHRRYVFWQDPLELLDIFKNARPRPVEVGAVFKNCEDVGVSKHRLRADGLHMRGGQQRCYDRVGDLVLNNIGGLPCPRDVHDHLHIGDVRQSIQRNLPE